MISIHIWTITFFIDFTDSFSANNIDLAVLFCAKKNLLEKGVAPFISYHIIKQHGQEKKKVYLGL